LRPELDTREDIVIIEIADDTIKNLSAWPLPRDFHASLIDVLKESGAKAIAFDVLFSEPTLYDVAFMDSIEAAGCVYLAVAFYIEPGESRDYLPLSSSEILADIGEPFKEHIAGFGHINTFVDADGKVRSIPFFIRHEGKLVPHLALRLACSALGLDAERVEFSKGRVRIDGALDLPVSKQNAFLVNYPGKWKDTFRHVSYFQILKAYVDAEKGKTPQLDLAQFKDTICFVGLTATGTHDIKPMPLESNYPMLGLQVSVLNSILNGEYIRDAGDIINTLINLAVFALIIFICLRSSPSKSLVSSIAFGLGYFLISLAVFIWQGIWINLFLPLVIIASTYTGVTLYKFIDEARKKQLLEKELDIARKIQQSFLPADIKEFSGIKIISFMQPAKFVAGDLYDIIPLDDNNLGVFIGDVSGKGVSASLIMAQTISLFRIFAKTTSNPEEVLMKLNRELCRVCAGRFVTALYLVIDVRTRLLRVCSAGHSPVVVYDSKTNSVEEFLPDSGLPLGVLDSVEYECFQRNIHQGDKFFLYTDGVTEARNRKGQEFGIERVRELLSGNKDDLPGNIMDGFVGKIFSFTRGLSQHDDITMILLGFDAGA
jgi:CHASE2 domain-containing sensor protein